MVRGNPSNTKPLAQSAARSRSSTMPRTTSSGTRSPRSISGLAFCPNSVPRVRDRAACLRSRDAALRNARQGACACVPLPAPGGPKKITGRFRRHAHRRELRLNYGGCALCRVAHKTVVVPHDELRFHLLNRIHRDADHNQQRRSAEIESDAQAFKHESPHMRVEPFAAEPHRQVLEVNRRKSSTPESSRRSPDKCRRRASAGSECG